jgi:hypothetical protein
MIVMAATTNLRTRLAGETGTALIIALMAMMLLTALSAAVIMVTSTETKISNNYSAGQEALYAADAAIERVVQDLLMVPRWNDILTGSAQSAFVDGAIGPKQLIGGGTMDMWGANNPQWRLFAWGPLSQILPNDVVDSPMYVLAWIADDPAESDGNPLADVNGTLTVHAEAIGPGGTRKVIEVTVARTTSTEIERGQIAQRGQEELNQRARKAAVQTPGKTLTNMRMNTTTGGLAVQ